MKLTEKLSGYQTKIKNVLTELDSAKDEILLNNFKNDKNYKIFRHKIKSIHATRNSEHYSELDCHLCRDGDGKMTNTLEIEFKNGSKCLFEIDIDGNNEYEWSINDTYTEEDTIASIETIVEGLGMDKKYAKKLLQLIVDIVYDQNLNMDHDICDFPTIDSESDS